MIGTFKEIMEYYGVKDMEFDAVIGDVDMEYTFSFCGKPKFTAYCMEKYGDLLNSKATIKPDLTGRYTDVVIVDYPDDEIGERFSAAWAGYVSETEYDKLFEEGDNDED